MCHPGDEVAGDGFFQRPAACFQVGLHCLLVAAQDGDIHIAVRARHAVQEQINRPTAADAPQRREIAQQGGDAAWADEGVHQPHSGSASPGMRMISWPSRRMMRGMMVLGMRPRQAAMAWAGVAKAARSRNWWMVAKTRGKSPFS